VDGTAAGDLPVSEVLGTFKTVHYGHFEVEVTVVDIGE